MAQEFPPILEENVGGELEDVIVVVVVHTNVQDNVLRSTSDAEPVSVSHLARKKADVPAALAYCNEQWKE